MDIYDYLKLDHEHVAQLFKQFEESKLIERRKQIAAFIAQELLIHAHSEQETLYKALKQFDSTKKEALHGQKEHKEIEDQISLVMHSKEFGTSWIKKVEKLKELVDHHVTEEEGDIFKHAKKVLSKEDAYVIKEQMHYLKQHLLLSLKKSSLETVNSTNKLKSKALTVKRLIKDSPKSSKKTASKRNPGTDKNRTLSKQKG